MMRKVHKNIGHFGYQRICHWVNEKIEYLYCLCDWRFIRLDYMTRDNKKVTCKRCLKIMGKR